MNEIDQELVGRLLRGERAAFDEFFNEYYPKLYRFVKRRMPPDAAGCEDVAQATLCRALESLHGYRGEAALMTWLCTICRRELARALARKPGLGRGAGAGRRRSGDPRGAGIPAGERAGRSAARHAAASKCASPS